MFQPEGIRFAGYQHRTFQNEEIHYKHAVLGKGRKALQLNKWPAWTPGRGRILRCLREACVPAVTANLLTHKYGPPKALTVVDPSEVERLEAEARKFMCGPGDFGRRFDEFAEYLRDNGLGCDWEFVSYLAFLAEDGDIFTVASGTLDDLLAFYGLDARIAGRVEWARYQVLAELSNILRDYLAIYGPANPIELQSYMWVVARLVKGKTYRAKKQPEEDWVAELQRRLAMARKREEDGLAGEQFVVDQERQLLTGASRSDLADKVKHSGAADPNCGYDVTSFWPDGRERHLEVKTTSDDPSSNRGFWLSENERLVAERDPIWEVIRVWNIRSAPRSESLGNVVRESSGDWKMAASSWFVERLQPFPCQKGVATAT
jgi:hypothetical protein